MSEYVVGIDIGGSFIRIGLIDDKYQMFEVKKVKTDEVVDNFNEFVIDFVRTWKNQYHIVAVSMGFPGVVKADSLEAVFIPNQHKLEGKQYLHDLQNELELPLYIDKDTNYLFLNDIASLNLMKTPSILAFYVGTGFGNAIRMNHELVRGDRGAAGEIGHIPIFNTDIVCGCGNLGCTETLASGVRLRNLHQMYFQETPIENMFTKHASHPELVSFVRNIALAIAVEITLLDITTIVLGGGVINMPDFPRVLLEDSIKGYLRNDSARKSLAAYYATSNPENGIIGAGIHAFSMMKKKVTI